MTTLMHDCRERQPMHDRIAAEIEAWLRDNHQIEVIQPGVITKPVDYFNPSNIRAGVIDL